MILWAKVNPSSGGRRLFRIRRRNSRMENHLDFSCMAISSTISKNLVSSPSRASSSSSEQGEPLSAVSVDPRDHPDSRDMRLVLPARPFTLLFLLLWLWPSLCWRLLVLFLLLMWFFVAIAGSRGSLSRPELERDFFCRRLRPESDESVEYRSVLEGRVGAGVGERSAVRVSFISASSSGERESRLGLGLLLRVVWAMARWRPGTCKNT